MKFKDVAHLYKGVMMKTELGIFPLVCYHKGDWWLDTIHYGAKAVEQDIKPILRRLSDITDDEIQQCEGITYDYGIFEYVGPLSSYLLSRGFDMHNLIDLGEAIDAETLTPNPYRT